MGHQMGKTEFLPSSITKEVDRSSNVIEALRLPTDRLDSWKEIANHLGREVRTVQLWEKLEGLPVHRHFHRKLGSVFAFRSDGWREGTSRAPTGSAPDANRGLASIPNATKRRRKRVMIAVLPFDNLGGSPEQ